MLELLENDVHDLKIETKGKLLANVWLTSPGMPPGFTPATSTVRSDTYRLGSEIYLARSGSLITGLVLLPQDELWSSKCIDFGFTELRALD